MQEEPGRNTCRDKENVLVEVKRKGRLMYNEVLAGEGVGSNTCEVNKLRSQGKQGKSRDQVLAS